jgi:hypothetical protein
MAVTSDLHPFESEQELKAIFRACKTDRPSAQVAAELQKASAALATRTENTAKLLGAWDPPASTAWSPSLPWLVQREMIAWSAMVDGAWSTPEKSTPQKAPLFAGVSH